jgi:MHS family proline/betaine transporter-like MFS transporter
MPAVWIMFFAVVAGVAMVALHMRESAKRPLIGSFPSVETPEEAEQLVATQDTNPLINTSEMPILVEADFLDDDEELAKA